MQGFGDQFLVDMGTVAIGRVEEVVTNFVRALQDAKRIRPVFRRSPYLRAAHAHRAEPETIDAQVTTNCNELAHPLSPRSVIVAITQRSIVVISCNKSARPARFPRVLIARHPKEPVMKIFATALLVALGLSGCIAVPVYEGPAYRSHGYYSPGYYRGGYYGGGGYRYRSERYP